jgi:hypothetical protein
MGRTATLWWRDDDAVEPTPALERLLAVQEAAAVPLCLAVVPRGTGAELAARIARSGAGQASRICVAAHGLAHVNHAPPSEKKAEFGPHRPAEVMAGEIAAGWDIIRKLFGDHAVPIFVPPWNRMAPELTGHIAAAGFAGVSALASGQLPPGVTEVTVRDVHVDIIDWRAGRRFVGEAVALGALVDHLRARRAGGSADAEPTGLLTHHLVHDDEAWEFLTRLISVAHESARWLSAREVFSLT